jgi:ABC-type transporter Mla subunit MlaD
MAKRSTESETQESQVATKIEDFAEDLGRVIGTAQKKAESWLAQRKQITDTLVSIRDEATRLLNQLGHEVEQVRQHARRGRPPGKSASENPSPEVARRGRPRKQGLRGWTAAQRAAAGERMRKYWATRKKS